VWEFPVPESQECRHSWQANAMWHDLDSSLAVWLATNPSSVSHVPHLPWALLHWQVIVLIPFGVQGRLDHVSRVTLPTAIHIDLCKRVWQLYKRGIPLSIRVQRLQATCPEVKITFCCPNTIVFTWLPWYLMVYAVTYWRNLSLGDSWPSELRCRTRCEHTSYTSPCCRRSNITVLTSMGVIIMCIHYVPVSLSFVLRSETSMNGAPV